MLNQVFDAEWKGSYGELLTERELKLVQLFGRSGKTLRNVYVPKDNGETSEIDVLFITQKGIFVIESKNYSGWIFGDADSTYWTAMLPNRQKNFFYNPVKQNETHIRWLGRYLDGGVPLFSLIVFSERCELKRISVPSPDVSIIKRDQTYATVRSIWEGSPNVLGKEQVNAIYEKLAQLAYKEAAQASVVRSEAILRLILFRSYAFPFGTVRVTGHSPYQLPRCFAWYSLCSFLFRL